MRNFYALLTSLLPSLAVAITPISLPIRALDGGFQKAKYKVDSAPNIRQPRNLSSDRIKEFEEFLRSHGQNIKPAERELLLERVRYVLATLDISYKEPISTETWERLLRESRESFANNAPTASSSRDWENSIDEMLQQLVAKIGDPHSRYLNREKAFDEQRTISYGLGVYLEKGARGVKLRVILPDSPAEKAGLLRGDEVIAVDGRDLQGQASLRNFYKPAGQPMTMKVLRAGSVVEVVAAIGELRKQELHARMAADGIGYVHFGEFGRDEDKKVFAAIDALLAAGARKLILDIRGNPGGYVSMARSIASEFLEADKPIDTLKKRGRIDESSTVDGPGRYLGTPVAVLVNEGSASASEMLAAALQDYKRATIVGSRTYGKGSFQSNLPTLLENVDSSDDEYSLPFYPDGSLLVITQGTWHTPNGRSVQGRHDPALGRNVPGSGGVEPDVVVDLDEARKDAVEMGLLQRLYGRAAEFEDPALERALQVLQR